MKSLDSIYSGPLYTTSDNSTVTISATGYNNITSPTYTVDNDLTLTYNDLPCTGTVTLGNTVITEEKLRKIDALLKVIEDLEDDNPLKECYNAQQMFDKMK